MGMALQIRRGEEECKTSLWTELLKDCLVVVEAVEGGRSGVAEEEEEDGVATAEMTWKLCSNLTRDELSASTWE